MKKFAEYILKCLKAILQWLIDQTTIVDIIIIVFSVFCILIFQHLPNIKLDNLQFIIEGILILGALIFAIFFPIAKSKKKLHEKKEKAEKRENDSIPK